MPCKWRGAGMAAGWRQHARFLYLAPACAAQHAKLDAATLPAIGIGAGHSSACFLIKKKRHFISWKRRTDIRTACGFSQPRILLAMAFFARFGGRFGHGAYLFA
jgi:hypothetical protein